MSERENPAALDWHGKPLTDRPEGHHPGRLRRMLNADELAAKSQLETNQAILDRLVGLARVADALENLVGTTRRRVLWAGTATIAANGAWSIDTRQPSRAICVTNYTNNGQAVVVAGPPQGAAPGAGPGTHLLPAGVCHVFQGETTDWTIYGTPGDSLNVEIFGVPVQPFAAGAI